jgi:hypothetical protein
LGQLAWNHNNRAIPADLIGDYKLVGPVIENDGNF